MVEPFAEDTASRQQEPGHELVLLVWRRSFQKHGPENDAERAVYQRLINLVADYEGIEEAALTSILLRDVSAKMQYLDPEWGFVDASNIGKEGTQSSQICALFSLKVCVHVKLMSSITRG